MHFPEDDASLELSQRLEWVGARGRSGQGPDELEQSLRELAVSQTSSGEGTKLTPEELLHKAETRYRVLVEQIPAITFMASLDESENEMYVSPQIEKILGYTQEEWLSDPTLWFTRLHPEDRERWNIEFAQTCASSKPFRSEYRFLSRDNRVVWVLGEARVARDPQGRPMFLQGVAFDITEQKRAEEYLRRRHVDLEEQVEQRTSELRSAISSLESQVSERQRAESALIDREARLRSVFETAVDGIIVIDEHGIIESLNPAACRILGYQESELIGQNVSILMESPSRENHDAYIANYLRTGVRKIIGIGREVVGLRKDGSTFPLELAISEMKIGTSSRFTGIVRDISDRKQVEQDLLEARQYAEGANRAKSQFLANMSHEIRTPMTAILGFAEALQESVDKPEHRSAIATIQRNGEHLLELINDILDLSKVEAGKMNTERIRCSPVQIIADVESLMRVRTEAKGLALKIRYLNPIPEAIESDPTRLKQILVNLVGNAIKFTETGEVRIEIAYREDADSAVMQIDVVDTGIGVSPEQMDRLFHPFAQADNSTTRKYGGTGLGLTISQRMAEMLGGKLSAHSHPGAGSRFGLTIPVVKEAGARMLIDPRLEITSDRPVATKPQKDALAGVRILLAEDGIDNQRLIVHVLSKVGADLCVVENGKQAMDTALVTAAGGTPFHVILMDMQMPIMDGYEATESLRARGYQGPIIALTAHAMAGDRERCIRSGCSDYETKPIDRTALIRKIQQHVHLTPV